MSAAVALENYVLDVVHRAIVSISADQARDIYALSFWIYADDDDPRRYVLDLSYNTTSHATRSERDASCVDEAKWNFAFWLQNEIAVIGNEDDSAAGQLRTAWLDECGLNFTDEDEQADLDRCTGLAEGIEDAFWRMCARIGKRLHDAGVLSSAFGRPIPIILHNLEYYDKVAEYTRIANPDGVADEFLKWVHDM